MVEYCVGLSIGYGVVLLILWNLTLIGLEVLKPYPLSTFASFFVLSILVSVSAVLLGSIINCLFQFLGVTFFGVSPQLSITIGWLAIGFLISIMTIPSNYANPFTITNFLKLLYDIGTTSYSLNVLSSPMLYNIGNFTLNVLGSR